jgi:CPA2 family monovalent cation:H+ antiporter-2
METPGFLAELAVILVVAAALGYLASRLRVVPIVAFLLAGVLIGPHALRLVQDVEVVDAAAEIGVILLLFTIGIEFSLERLARILRLIVVGGGLQVGLTIAVVTGGLAAVGVDWSSAVFTSFLLALSSTAIVLKVLADRGGTATPTGQITLAMLILQDLAVVAMMLVVPLLGGDGGSLGALAWAVLKAAGIVAVVLLGARRVMPRLLAVVARTCSVEVFLLTVIGICFGTAYLTSLAGLSVSLGAFLAGLLVSESEHSEHAFGEVLPLQILFSAVFFVSVGMLLDLRFLVSHAPLVLAGVALVLAVKVLTSSAAARAVQGSLAVSVGAAFVLAQVGEFSFVLQRVGAEHGLSPAGMGEDGGQAFIATTVLLMVATPWLAGLGDWLGNRIGSRIDSRIADRTTSDRASRDTTPAGVPGPVRSGHTVISGWGPAAQSLTGELSARGYPFTVVTLSPDGAATARDLGYDVLLGDSTRTSVLAAARVPDARVLVVADDDPTMTHRIASVVRRLAPAAVVVVRPDGPAHLADLAAAGADHVVDAERLSHAGLRSAVLRALDGAVQAGRTPAVDVTRLLLPPPPPACPHAVAAEPVLPDASGCGDCLRVGRTDWVHLRACLSCGHVGCCDSSPLRHATAHFAATSHPIMQSMEPGESWAYCFVDAATL